MAPGVLIAFEVLDSLLQCEASFQRPPAGCTRDDFERMIAESFWEIGASGRRYDRQDVLQTVDARMSAPPAGAWDTSDVRCAQLCATTFLLSYALRQPQRLSRRSTIWRHTDGQRQMLFHQGISLTDG